MSAVSEGASNASSAADSVELQPSTCMAKGYDRESAETKNFASWGRKEVQGIAQR